MPNGFSTEQMIKFILDGQNEIREDIKVLTRKVDCVMNNGCAHRPDDLRRIDDLETWRTRGIIGIVVLSVGMVVDFIMGASK